MLHLFFRLLFGRDTGSGLNPNGRGFGIDPEGG